MCGIFGYIDFKRRIDESILVEMRESLKHRGPDDSGYQIFESANFQVSLGHVRLSILDLSQAGHQPMNFLNYSIVYNGEVYNYREIRKELVVAGHTFVSDCDTEVILHAFSEWGVKCVNKFIGMFAFVIYDSDNEKLYLFRDRAGVKPLFYYCDNDIFAFSSELKAITKIPYFKKDICNQSVTYFLQLGYIPMEQCVYKNARKLNAGCWLEYNLNTRQIEENQYWDIEDYYRRPKLSITYTEAKAQLKELLKSAFSYRLISDVPVGVFLSGGFDSSAVASILTKELNITPKTFTIGFYEGNNEAPDAEAISKILGTKHKSYYCTYKEAMDLIPSLPFYYDEPFSDVSAIPTTLVSKVARNDVKVILSADGGDETFAGYVTYDVINNIYPYISFVPRIIQRAYNPIYKMVRPLISPKHTIYIQMLDSIAGLYKDGKINQKEWVFNSFNWGKSCISDMNYSMSKYDCRDLLKRIDTCYDSPEYQLLFDYKTTMKDCFLVKVDRATMSVSLEGREPLLDHRIAEFAAQLPWEYKYRKGEKKRILKDIVYDYLPKELMNKPKRGFGIPLDNWLRSELKDYVHEILSPENLKSTGFDVKHVQTMIDNFENKNYRYGSNFRGYSNLLWRLIQYHAWYNMWAK